MSVRRDTFLEKAIWKLSLMPLVMSLALQAPSVALAAGSGMEDNLRDGKMCPGGVLDIILPEPPAGMVSTMDVTLDDNCQPVFGPVKLIPQSQLALRNTDNSVTGKLATLSESLPGREKSSRVTALAGSGSRCFHADLTLRDPIGIALNWVYADVCWSWNGSVVTSYSNNGGWGAHAEYTPAGPGWTGLNAYNNKTAGCVGCGSVSFRQHTEFSYRGVFDASGNLYYNTIDVYETINGSGSRTCAYTLVYRNWFSGWFTTNACT